MRGLLKFTICSLAILLPIVAGIAVLRGSREAWIAAGCFGLCVMLTAICIAFSQQSVHHGATWQMAAVLGGSMGRCAVTFAIAVGLSKLSELKESYFVVWIAVGYFVTLLFESMVLFKLINDRKQIVS